MTDRPIIFSAAMVQALLAGRKTQTRRLATSPLRYCKAGDRLYVREAYAVRGIFSDVVEVGYKASERASHTEYVEQIPIALVTGAKVTWPNSRPSIHMPRWASRLTLTITDVRVEPLHQIKEADAIAEGIEYATTTDAGVFYRNYLNPSCPMYPVGSYRSLWNSLHTDPLKRWDDFPEVVALTFTVTRGNIDRPAE